QFFGEQVQDLVAVGGVFGGQAQVVVGAFQGAQVALAGQPGGFAAGVPARDVQQGAAQLVQALFAAGGDGQHGGAVFLGGQGGLLFGCEQVDLVVDAEHGHVRGQAFGDGAVQAVLGLAGVQQVHDEVGLGDIVLGGGYEDE